MTNIDLLNRVQPSEGWYAALGIRGKSVIQKLVQTREEFDVVTAEYVADGRDAYFGVAKFKSDANRTKENVELLKAFWLDLDCGETKAEVNPKTGRPDGYIDQVTALNELQRFCKLVGLPIPLLVNSGRGIHAYWPLTESVTPDQWEPVAARLYELCLTHNLYVDASVFEIARVLRVPGTFNFKDTPPKPVEILSDAEDVEYDAFKDILGVKESAFQPKPKRELTALGKSMADNVVKKFSKIMIRSAKDDGCKQLMFAYENPNDVNYDYWRSVLSIAAFCEDGDLAAHRISEGADSYDPEAVEEKVDNLRRTGAPHSCAQFDKVNPGGCEGCPHKGKIHTPIVLGKEVLEADEEDNVVTVEAEYEEEEDEVHHIPKYPDPYFRGKNGGVYFTPAEEEADPICIYENDLYVVKRMKDPVVGEVAVMKLHLPLDGVKEFVIPLVDASAKETLRTTLASHGVVCMPKKVDALVNYVLTFIKELQFRKKAELMRTQFGWADRNSKFIIGDREISKDGIFHSPPSSTTQQFADMMQPVGTLEKWQEVFNLYGLPGLEAHAFAALTAFGSPLLGFAGQNGAIINVIHKDSGTGKSTTLYMCNSVYGNPERLCSIWKDTLNAKMIRLGVMNNLPFTIDEMTNTSPADFSTLAYSMSQGRGSDRAKASANELRLNLTTWKNISLASSNASFYQKLSSLKNSPDGEMMRLLEYSIGYTDVIEPHIAKQMFDHQLKENYGHAGDIYANWLVNNLEEAVDTLKAIQAKIDKELKLSQKERFWSSVVACNITGGLIAKNLGLINFDMKAIYAWAAKMILGMREEVKAPVSDVASIIGDFVNRHMSNILIVNDAVDQRTNMPSFPVQEPKGDLVIRYEPDTKKMFIVAKAFKKDCVELQIDYKDTLDQLKKRGAFVGAHNKRMSKGMKIVSPGVHSLEFDCSVDDFINMDAFVSMTEAENADREGQLQN